MIPTVFRSERIPIAVKRPNNNRTTDERLENTSDYEGSSRNIIKSYKTEVPKNIRWLLYVWEFDDESDGVKKTAGRRWGTRG